MFKHFCKILLVVLIVLLAVISTNANNLQIANIMLTGQNTGSHYVMVQFNISWENSWRNTSAAPYNWDAAYLFVKYRKTSDNKWYHATLSANYANYNTGSQAASASFTPLTYASGTATGAFFYQSASSSNTISAFASSGAQMRWDYGNDISDNLNHKSPQRERPLRHRVEVILLD